MAKEIAKDTSGVARIELGEKRETKLATVKEELQRNPGLFYAGEIFKYPGRGYWTETVDIIIAPNKPILDADRLDEFMHGLIKKVRPSQVDNVKQHNTDSDFILGKLHFDEKIGERNDETTTTITAVDPEALQRAKINIGKSQETVKRDIERKTWVRVYPDPSSAKIVHDYELGVNQGTVKPNPTFDYLQHWIEPDQLREMKANQEPTVFRKLIVAVKSKKKG